MAEDNLIAGAESGAASAAPRPAARLPHRLDIGQGLVVEVRAIAPDDAGSVAALLAVAPTQELLPFAHLLAASSNDQRWRETVHSDRTYGVLAARDDGVVAGVCLVERCRAPAMEHTATLEIVVAPGWRGRGLGAALVASAVELAYGAGVSKLIAPALFTAAPALALFRRLGFQIEALLRGQVRDAEGQPHDLVLMALDLEEWSRRMALYGVADALEA